MGCGLELSRREFLNAAAALGTTAGLVGQAQKRDLPVKDKAEKRSRSLEKTKTPNVAGDRVKAGN
jgi:hypothetical protein